MLNLFKIMREETLCKEHGRFENVGLTTPKGIAWSGCPICSRQIIVNENSRMAKRERRRNERRALAEACLPERFKNKGLDSYVVKNEGQGKALKSAYEYVNQLDINLSEGAGLLLYGKPGTGKTHLSVGIALEALAEGYSVRYARSACLLRSVKETWGKNVHTNETEAYKRICEPDLLIIDEIGRQFGTDAEKMILFEIINSRYEQMKPIIAITNLDANNLFAYLGEASFDRIRENGTAILFDWDSMRFKK